MNTVSTFVTRAALRLALLGAVAASAVPTAAQTRPGPGDARERLERQVRERFQQMIQEELGIDEAVTASLRATMESFMEERRGLGMRQGELRRRLRSSGSLLDADEARAVLDEIVAVQRAEVDLLAREQTALLEILTPPQLVRFYTLREQFGERVRALRGGPPGAGRRPGGGSGGPTAGAGAGAGPWPGTR